MIDEPLYSSWSGVDVALLISLLPLLVLSAFFSCSETAFFRITQAQSIELQQRKTPPANAALRLIKQRRTVLITILIGNMTANVFFFVVSSVIMLRAPGGVTTEIGIALATTLLSFAIGGSLGLIAAISGGWLDQLLSRFVDVLMAIPGLIFALMLLTIFGSSILSLIMIIAVLDSTRVFRLTRSVSVSVVVMDYVEAAKLRGEKLGWIMRREILPNIMPPLIAEFGLRFSFVFLTIAALSFLGLGIQPPTADWGSMVRDNASMIQFAKYDLTAALTPMIPAGAIALLTVAVNFVVDWFLHITSGLNDEH